MSDDLADEMRLHDAEPFPGSVEKGRHYGQVDAVMIGAETCPRSRPLRSGRPASR